MRPPTHLPRLAPLLLAVACGAPAPAVTTVEVTARPEGRALPLPPPSAPLPPLDPSLPAGAVGLASVDVAGIDALVAGILAAFPEDRRALERRLHLPADALAHGGLSPALALDPARPLVASLSITPGGKAALDHLRALAEHPPPPESIVGELRRTLRASPGAGFWIRFVVPSKDPEATLRALGPLLDLVDYGPSAAPEGVEALYAARHDGSFAALSPAPSAVVLDLVIPGAVAEGDRPDRAAALEMIHDLRARPPEGPHDAPVPLDGAVVRVAYTPAAFAGVILLGGVSATLRALGGDAGDPHAQAEVAAEGLHACAQVYPLAGDGRGAFFDRIELWIDGAFGTLGAGARATPGPAGPLVAEAWAPGTAVAFPAHAWLEVSLPWIRAWASLGSDPFHPRDILHTVSEAGGGGLLVALPQRLAAAAWESMGDLAAPSDLLRRLERLTGAALHPDRDEVFLGLFAAGTRPADLACVLVPPDAPCGPSQRLRPGAVTHAGHLFYKLVQARGRWILVAAPDKTSVDAARPDLLPAPAAPVRGGIPGGASLAGELLPLPAVLFADRYRIEATLEAGRPTVRARPAP